MLRTRRRGNLNIWCSTYCKHCSSLRSMPFLEHCRLFLRKIVKFAFGSGLDIGLYILVKKQRLKSYFRLILLKTNFVLVREFVQHTARNTISNAFVPGTPEHRDAPSQSTALRDGILCNTIYLSHIWKSGVSFNVFIVFLTHRDNPLHSIPSLPFSCPNNSRTYCRVLHTSVWELKREGGTSVRAFSACDQHLISPINIHKFSSRQVVRI